MDKITAIRNLCLNEHQTLRNEVITVKECQVGILKWAYLILGTVLSFSWGLVLVKGDQPTDTFFQPNHALPAATVLIIGTILGAFLVQIIVHKTRSVFRMCGYIRVLEKLLAEPESPEGKYPGYENTYHTLRIIQQKERKGFDINFLYALKEFANDIKDKLPSFCKRKKKSNDNDRNIPPPSSGKYYRRIAFQVHFLGLLSLASAIFLLFLSTNISSWKIFVSALCIVSAVFWVISYIRCTAQTRMQEKGDHSIDGQFKLWCKAMAAHGYDVDP